MSVFDKIKELEKQRVAIEAQKDALLEDARKEALAKAQKAVDELNSLGYKYRITGGSGTSPGGRRSGIRQQVLDTVSGAGNGMSRSEVLRALNAQDKSAQQSVSNALANLKKQGKVTLVDGIYRGA